MKTTQKNPIWVKVIPIVISLLILLNFFVNGDKTEDATMLVVVFFVIAFYGYVTIKDEMIASEISKPALIFGVFYFSISGIPNIEKLINMIV